MRAFLLAAAIAAAAPAFAGVLTARQGDDSVRLTDEPCTNKAVIEAIGRLFPGTAPDSFNAASAIFQGRSYQACWRMVGNAAYLVYDDGDQGLVPASDLRPQPEA